MVLKDIEARKEYQSQWYLRKKSGLPTRTTKIISKKEKIKMTKKRVKKASITLRIKKKRIMDEILGNNCKLCQSKRSMKCHRKNGSKHKDLSCMSLEDLRNELETGDYVRLCSRCHGCVHWCMNILSMDWDDINKN